MANGKKYKIINNRNIYIYIYMCLNKSIMMQNERQRG